MIRLIRRGVVVLTTAMVAVLAAAAPSAAHVTATPDEADSPFFRTTLRIGHGCEGSPTTAVRVQVPEGIENPRPEVVPGWDIELAEDGGTVTEIAWRGGSLPDAHFQEFGLSFRITEDAPEVLWLPTVQECEEGEHRWIEIPASVAEWGDLDEPAPYVINNVAAGGDEGHGDETAGDETAGDDEAAGAGGPSPAAAESDDDGGTGPLPVLALVAGLLGLAAGVAALLVALRTRSRAA